MKYSDIIEKFLILYDKDEVTSSYPSLTAYEIATILDKAYLALIAQKLTGKNNRNMPFEGDLKAIEDVRPLLSTDRQYSVKNSTIAQNELVFELPDQLLYALQFCISLYNAKTSILPTKEDKVLPVTIIGHSDALNLFTTETNIPWIEVPKAYIEGNYAHVLIDPYEFKKRGKANPYLNVTFIKKPKMFLSAFGKDKDLERAQMTWKTMSFELSDTVAQELINLAIIMALENVESSRLQTKVSTSRLES